MGKRTRAMVARVTLASLVAMLAPAASLSAEHGGRLEGVVAAPDGRAAAGWRVHLIDNDGRDVAQTATSDDGVYTFASLAPGEYSLAMETVDGKLAPVAAPPVRLASDELARRDVRAMQANEREVRGAVRANYGIGLWWAGLSPMAKVWTVVGIIAITGITVAAVSDDDEEDASPSDPDR